MARHYEMPDSTTVATEDPAHGFEVTGRKPPGQHTLKLLAAPIIGLIVLSNVGDALAPELVNSHPLQLLAMNARNRNLINTVASPWLITCVPAAPTLYISRIP